MTTNATQCKSPVLFVCRNGTMSMIPLSGKMVMGRTTDQVQVDIDLKEKYVSRRHGLIECNEWGCSYMDTGSRSGTCWNGVKLKAEVRITLSDGDVLQIYNGQPEVRKESVTVIYSTNYPDSYTVQALELNENMAEVNIGSAGDERASYNQASFFAAEEGWAVMDHNSESGVYVNNQRLLNPRHLQMGDCVRIAGQYFVFTGNMLIYQVPDYSLPEKQEAGTQAPEDPNAAYQVRQDQGMPNGNVQNGNWQGQGMPNGNVQNGNWQDRRMPGGYVQNSVYEGSVSHTQGMQMSGGRIPGGPSAMQVPNVPLKIRIEERSVWQRARKLMLLQDINMTINSGEMVLILGGSGAGKTTFMNAVMGYEKAQGKIMHGDVDIYQDFGSMKYKIGFVPQQDLLRGSDTVYDTVENAAEMKLPSSMHKGLKSQRIEKVLETLGLQRERESLVSKLSGGQRKRLSIAVEYIADPSLFFLDEPDSGLDGIMAKALMTNLRTIADEGKIVMVISHGPDRAAAMFDKVIVLAKSTRDNCGHLAFFGTVEEAYAFFETDTLEGVVKRINREDEGGDGLSDYYIEKYAGRI